MKFGGKLPILDFRLHRGEAAGIDISQQRVSIALLKMGKNGPELIRSVSTALPEGVVKDGNIGDAGLLSKSIRELKVRGKIRTTRAAVSARPVISQILEMPRQTPPNIRQFVLGELKNCAALPGRDIVFDFCTIGSGRRSAEKKMLAVAAEETRLLELVGVCSKAGFEVETVEPALFAYVRAVYSKKAGGSPRFAGEAGKTGSNSLLGIFRDNVLTLCVLKNGALDFIRTKQAPSGQADSDEMSRWASDELSEVVRFYDIEVPENTGKWDVTVLVESPLSANVVEERLKTQIQNGRLQVRTAEDAWLDASVNLDKSGQAPAPDEKRGTRDEGRETSAVAVGLAMRLLKAQPADFKTNLVPQQVVKAREAKRDALIAANAVAIVWLIMILAISGFSLMIENITRTTFTNRRLITKQDTGLMLQQHQELDGRLNILSSRLDRLSQISASYNDVNLTGMLNDIRGATPGSVMITAVTSPDNMRVTVEGLATSNEAVNLFIGLLEKSPVFSSVTLLEARKQEGQKGLITYQLSCRIKKQQHRLARNDLPAGQAWIKNVD